MEIMEDMGFSARERELRMRDWAAQHRDDDFGYYAEQEEAEREADQLDEEEVDRREAPVAEREIDEEMEPDEEEKNPYEIFKVEVGPTKYQGVVWAIPGGHQTRQMCVMQCSSCEEPVT